MKQVKIEDKIFRIAKSIREIYYKSIFDINPQNKLRIYGKLIVKHPNKIILGNNIAINDYVYLQGMGGIRIEDDVVISAYAKLISAGLETNYDVGVSGQIRGHTEKEIFINKGCWIGAGAIVLPGVRIMGEGVVVAAGAVVTSDINEDNVIVGGIPAKVIKKVDGKRNNVTNS